MVSGEFPARPIVLHAQSMSGREMASKHLAAPAAFEANNIITMNRSPDRHGGCPLTFGFGCGFSEPGERPMDGRDQLPELVGPDLVSPNICGDNVGREFSVNRGGWCFPGHHGSPVKLTRYHPRLNLKR
jgi:hypothetical protein